MDNRQNIIDATDRLLQTHGLARLTTREIAREAKVAEGLIYHHFKDKAELIFEVVEIRVRESKDIMQNLPLEVGKSTLIKNLEDVLLSIYHAHYEISPIICTIFADQKLHVRMQEIVEERNMGPAYAIDGLDAYLAAEQRLGRLSDAVDTKALAKCLWMISTQCAMLDRLMKNTSDETQVIKEIRDYLKTLKTGFEPRTKQKKSKN
ncbi:MAG: TetR/AcrR family transcriptional regulator [Deltaproteobacteria bacterium]|nr:TetR/AcrR family transcriptional regulator [Deltaproteobacteria bacterium]